MSNNSVLPVNSINKVIPENVVDEIPESSVKTRKTKKVQHNKTKSVSLSESDSFSSGTNIHKDLNALLKNTKPINYGSRAVRSFLHLLTFQTPIFI